MATKSTFNNMLKKPAVSKEPMTEGDMIPSKKKMGMGIGKKVNGRSSYAGMLKKGEKC